MLILNILIIIYSQKCLVASCVSVTCLKKICAAFLGYHAKNSEAHTMYELCRQKDLSAIDTPAFPLVMHDDQFKYWTTVLVIS